MGTWWCSRPWWGCAAPSPPSAPPWPGPTLAGGGQFLVIGHQCFHSCVQSLVTSASIPVYSHRSSLMDCLAMGYGVLLCTVTSHPSLTDWPQGMCTHVYSHRSSLIDCLATGYVYSCVQSPVIPHYVHRVCVQTWVCVHMLRTFSVRQDFVLCKYFHY